MTSAQYELAVLIIKGIVNLSQRLDKVGQMSDDECKAAMPAVQTAIDTNDQIIQEL